MCQKKYFEHLTVGVRGPPHSQGIVPLIPALVSTEIDPALAAGELCNLLGCHIAVFFDVMLRFQRFCCIASRGDFLFLRCSSIGRALQLACIMDAEGEGANTAPGIFADTLLHLVGTKVGLSGASVKESPSDLESSGDHAI